MKKILFLLITLTLFSACSNNKKQEIFLLDEEYYNKNEIIEIDSNQFKELEQSKKNFGIFVHLAGCMSCSEFQKVLNEFTENNNITFYSIEYKEMKKTSISKFVEYAPSFIIYKDGEMVEYLNSVDDDDLPFYKSSDNFKEWITKYIKIK